ncbi:hypothetical protein ACHAWF_007382 [Thalassiosira exigua]
MWEAERPGRDGRGGMWELLERVMKRVGTGGKTLEEVIEANLAKQKPEEEGYAATTTTAKEKEREEEDAADEPLLNPSLCRHLRATLSNSSSPGARTLSDDDLAKLDAHHDEVLKLLDDAATKAKEEAGDLEVLGAKMAVVTYRVRCSSQGPALAAYEAVLALPKLSAGKKLHARLEMARVASFWGDVKKTKEVSEEARKVIAMGGNRDRRNRLKAYCTLSMLTVWDVEGANALLAEGVATFRCSELREYLEFVAYAIVTNLLYLKRPELKKKIVDGSEVLRVAKDIPSAIRLVNTLYDCNYEAYLHALVDLHPHLVADRYLQPHAGYLLRELHVFAFRQILDSYQSVTLDSMAKSFGVGTDFLDVQLSRFIAAGRLTAKIDKYGGVVETNRPDGKNARYQEMIQKGDLLLNRIQKLGRVVDL